MAKLIMILHAPFHAPREVLGSYRYGPRNLVAAWRAAVELARTRDRIFLRVGDRWSSMLTLGGIDPSQPHRDLVAEIEASIDSEPGYHAELDARDAARP